MNRSRSASRAAHAAAVSGGPVAGGTENSVRTTTSTEPLRLFDDADFGCIEGATAPAAGPDRPAGNQGGDPRGQDVPSAQKPRAEPNATADADRVSVIEVDRACPDHFTAPAGATMVSRPGPKHAARDGGGSGNRSTDQNAGRPELAPRLVSVVAAARLLGVGRSTLYELIARGDLEVVHIGRSARVTVCSVDAFVSKLRSRARGASIDVHRRPY